MNFNSSRDWWAFEAISKLVFTEDQDDADRTLTSGKGGDRIFVCRFSAF